MIAASFPAGGLPLLRRECREFCEFPLLAESNLGESL